MNLLLPMIFSNNCFFNRYNESYILASFFFLFAIMLIVYSYVILYKEKSPQNKIKNTRLSKLNKKDDNDIGGEVYQDALRILDKARADSLKILSRAQARAQGLLDSTYTISRENRAQLDQSLNDIYEKQERSLQNLSEELLVSYREAVETGKQENIRTLYEITDAMKKEALSGVDDFKNIIKKETFEAQNALENKMREEYAKIDEDIKEYKEEKIKNLHNNVLNILSDLYANVINENLDQIKYEKMILNMLREEINKSGISNGLEPKSNSRNI